MCSQSRDTTTSDDKFPGRIPKPAITNDDAYQQACGLASQVNSLSLKIADVGQQLVTLQSSLSVLTPCISSTSGGSLSPSVATAAKESLSNIISKPSPPSYAAKVPSDVSNAVKRAVAETFSKQRKADRDSAHVAVHGMPEKR